MLKNKRNKGITLIALVITIIILLILAGIAISQLTESGLFNKTQVAKDKYTIEEEKEQLEIEIANFKMQMYENSNGKEMTLNDLKTYFDSEKFNGEYMVELFYEPLATTEDVSVEPVYAKVTHVPTKIVFYVDGKLVVIGGSAEKVNNVAPTEEIPEIDSTAPQDATMTLSSTGVDVGGTITITITHSDNESEIKLIDCKYIVNQSSDEIGLDDAAWDTATAFETNPQTISITETSRKIDYLHVLSVDTAGNKKETVSDAIRFKSTQTLFNVTTNFSYHPNEISYSSSSTTQFRCGSGGTAYIISKSKVDVTNLSKIQFNYGDCDANRGNTTKVIKLGISTNNSDTAMDYFQSATFVGKSHGAGSLTLDVSQLTGEYYIKITLQPTAPDSYGGDGYLLLPLKVDLKD